MNKVILLVAALVVSPAFAKGSSRVRGYTTKTGKYVAPHKRTKPDRSKSNNWSAKGNVNPNTGKKGSK